MFPLLTAGFIHRFTSEPDIVFVVIRMWRHCATYFILRSQSMLYEGNNQTSLSAHTSAHF